MPAAQRQMMEQMMAQRGVNMNPGAGGIISIKSCITPEQAARHQRRLGMKAAAPRTPNATAQS